MPGPGRLGGQIISCAYTVYLWCSAAHSTSCRVLISSLATTTAASCRTAEQGVTVCLSMRTMFVVCSIHQQDAHQLATRLCLGRPTWDRVDTPRSSFHPCKGQASPSCISCCLQHRVFRRLCSTTTRRPDGIRNNIFSTQSSW